jgi:hypothetical protein
MVVLVQEMGVEWITCRIRAAPVGSCLQMTFSTLLTTTTVRRRTPEAVKGEINIAVAEVSEEVMTIILHRKEWFGWTLVFCQSLQLLQQLLTAFLTFFLERYACLNKCVKLELELMQTQCCGLKWARGDCVGSSLSVTQQASTVSRL